MITFSAQQWNLATLAFINYYILEFGFPLSLWTDAYLEPSLKNHSSVYSYHSHIDKIIDSELEKAGLTGPFKTQPWDDFMISPIMTFIKKT